MFVTQKRLLKWGLCLNVIYLFFHFLFIPDGFTLLNISITSLLLLSVFCIGTLCIIKFKQLKKIPITIRTIIYLLFFWSIITIIRGFSLNLQDWVTNFGNVFMGLAWLTPFTLILGFKIENWNILFKTISLGFALTIFACFLIPFTYVNEEWIWLLRPINFILLVAFYKYNSKQKFYFYLALMAYLIISFLGERRLEFLYLIITLSFILMDKIIKLNFKKVIIRYIFLVFLLLVFVIFTFGYEYISIIISTVVEFQDTRTFLFADFFLDLNFSEKLFGKGSLGTYFSEFIEHTRNYTINNLKKRWWGDEPTRITIEVGYLQMILKGGFIMFFLHISIYIYAAYVAIFKSKNKFIKRLGYYILIITIISLVEFRPAFTPTFILLWMAIGTVLSKKYREMDNSQIKNIIKI
tara:strand:- start:6909 stop:8135 length:1227 start_codon:yes stop_codon:yes gene_type:complete